MYQLNSIFLSVFIKCSEVREAIAKSKSDKASGPSGIVSEMLKAAGEPGVQWVTSIFNGGIREEEDSRRLEKRAG